LPLDFVSGYSIGIRCRLVLTPKDSDLILHFYGFFVSHLESCPINNQKSSFINPSLPAYGVGRWMLIYDCRLLILDF